MAIDLIDKIKPKNNGSFALVDAVDVEMPDGTRLSTWNGGGGSQLQTINLIEMGMGAVNMDGTKTFFETDVTAIMTALASGTVRFILTVTLDGQDASAEIMLNSMGAGGVYICSSAFDLNGRPMIFTMYVTEGTVIAYFTDLKSEAAATEINLTAFDTEGTIVETYADGSTSTTTMEFDSSGNPVKITDGDGNVTTLVW